MHRNHLPWGSPPDFEQPKYVTRIVGRQPEWKVHATLGLARSAFSGRFGEMWVYDGAGWNLAEERNRRRG